MKPSNVHAMKAAGAGDSRVHKALVVGRAEGGYSVSAGGETLFAKTAFSCLVTPAPGDRALCATDDGGECHILAILERPGEQDMTLSFPADARVVSEAGDITIAGGKNVNMVGAGVNLVSRKAVHKSAEAVIDYGGLVARGEKIDADFKTVRLVAGTLNTLARQVLARAKSYIRSTENADQVGAGQMTRRSQGLMAMDAKHTFIASEKETKIDGEHIFMG